MNILRIQTLSTSHAERHSLTLPAEAESVLPDPSGASGAALGLGGALALAEAAGALAVSGEATELAMLLDGVYDPVDLGIAPDGRVSHVHHDHLEVLVGGVLADPVRVQDSETLESATHSLLGDGLEVPLRLLLLDRTGALGLTIGTSLGDGALPASTPHGDPVDDKALLGLVAETAGLVGSGGPGSTVDLNRDSQIGSETVN